MNEKARREDGLFEMAAALARVSAGGRAARAVQAAASSIAVSKALLMGGRFMLIEGTAFLGAFTGFGAAAAASFWATSARSHWPTSWERATEKNRST